MTLTFVTQKMVQAQLIFKPESVWNPMYTTLLAFFTHIFPFLEKEFHLFVELTDNYNANECEL